MKIKLSGIAPQSLVNGEGLRKVYFSQGCSHHCYKCFNPETWTFEGGSLFDVDVLVKQLADEIYLDGVTFSGGDPFDQADKFAYFATQIKKQLNLNIWCYTGYTYQELLAKTKTDKVIEQLLKHIDVLVDGKFTFKLISTKLKYRGSTNQKLIDVPKSLKLNREVRYELK